MTVYLGFTCWSRSQLPQPHWIPVWLDSCCCHWNTQETSAGPSDWLTYHVVAVIVAPCMVMRTLFDWSIRFSPAAVSQKQKQNCTPCSPTDTHPPCTPFVTVYRLDAAPHVYTSHSQPNILTAAMYLDIVYNLLQITFGVQTKMYVFICSACRDVSLIRLIWMDMRFKVFVWTKKEASFSYMCYTKLSEPSHTVTSSFITYFMLIAADTKHGASLGFWQGNTFNIIFYWYLCDAVLMPCRHNFGSSSLHNKVCDKVHLMWQFSWDSPHGVT